MRCLALLAMTGCSLYFGSSSRPEEGDDDDVDAAPAVTCPKPGTFAEILYPLNGAVDVPQPVPIQMHVFIPNTLDGKGASLTDANGQPISLDHVDVSCSVGVPGTDGPTQDQTWTECYKDLDPDTVYSWHIGVTCYDESGFHPLVSSTFRTAP
jgi:hypothetical protein